MQSMADADYDESGTFGVHPGQRPAATLRGPQGQTWVRGAGALTSVALIVGLGVWAYHLAVRDVRGVPVTGFYHAEPTHCSMMHVVICTDGVFPQAMGGMQRHSRLLAEHLAATGRIKLTVIHPHEPGIFDPASGIKEVAIAPIDTRRLYLRELWSYSARVAKVLDTLRPDVILSQGFCVWQGMSRFSDRLILHPHGLEMFQGLTAKERLLGQPFRMAVRYMARRSNTVISLGGMLTGMLEQAVKGSTARVKVIPNAVDVTSRIAYAPSGSGPLRLLFVGRFAFNKGIDVLLVVARRLMKEGHIDRFRFILAGDSKLKVATALNTEEKRLWAAKKYGENNIMRIMNTTYTLFFRIGNSTLAEGDESIPYIILCKLMEDLYIYRMQGKDAADPKSWRLAECKCQLEKCLMGGLTLSVNVPASSLNELFNRTVQFYFSLQRSGSASAFNTFYPYDPQLHITFEGAKWKHYKALSDLRKLAVKKSN